MLRKGGVHQMIKAHYAKALMNEKFRLDFQRKMKINWYHTFQRKIFKNSNWYIFAPMCMLSFLWQSSVQFRANGTKRSRKPICAPPRMSAFAFETVRVFARPMGPLLSFLLFSPLDHWLLPSLHLSPSDIRQTDVLVALWLARYCIG